MNSKIFTFLLLIFTIIFSNSCSSRDEQELDTTSNSSQNPVQNSNKILKFVKSINDIGPTHYFQTSNGKVILWNDSYNYSINATIRMISYNAMGKIDKISNIDNSNQKEIQFKYNNNQLTEILYLLKDTSGNLVPYKSCTVQFLNSKLYRLIYTNFNNPQDYINDVITSSMITELEFSGENVAKIYRKTGEFSKSTGLINISSYSLYTREYTYSNTIINPYSTFPIEFQIFLEDITAEKGNIIPMFFSKYAKITCDTFMTQSHFSSFYFSYETNTSLNNLPYKSNSDNGNVGSRATFEYDSY